MAFLNGRSSVIVAATAAGLAWTCWALVAARAEDAPRPDNPAPAAPG